MYLYYFRSENGRCNDLYVAKIMSTKQVRRNELVAYIDENSALHRRRMITEGKYSAMPFVNTGLAEGQIRNRSFWLHDYDMNRAQAILNEYLNKKK